MAEIKRKEDDKMSFFDISIKRELIDRGFTNDIELFREMPENKELSFSDILSTQENWGKFRKWQNNEILIGNIKLDRNRVENWIHIYYGSMAKKFNANFGVMNEDFVKSFKNYEKEIIKLNDEWKKFNNKYFAGNKELPLFWKKTEDLEKKFIELSDEITKQIVNSDGLKNETIQNKSNYFNSFVAGNMSSKEIDDMIINQLEQSRIKSKEDKLEFLAWYSRFPCNDYSMRNKVAILIQCEENKCLPIVAGYNQFKEMNIHVLQGEKARIGICYKRDQTFYLSKDENGVFRKFVNYNTHSKLEKKACEEKVQSGEYKKITQSYFKWGTNLFTLEQTDLPESERPEFIQRYTKTNDTAENIKLYEKMLKLCDCIDIVVEEKNTHNSALGWITNDLHPDGANIVTINKDMPIDAKLSCLAHELGHYFMKHTDTSYYPERFKLSHKQKEIQAQLVSHLVLNSLGVDTQNESSAKYLNSYIGENSLDSDVMSSLSTEEFYKSLALVDDLSKKMSGCLKMEEITKENLTELIEFEPNFIEYDADENKFTIVNAKKFENHQIELIKKQTEEINSKKDMVNDVSASDEMDDKPKNKRKERVREHSIELTR